MTESTPERPAPEPPDDARAPSSMFSLEGRRVPALYLVGWIGTVMGLAILLVSFMAAGGGAARWLFLAGLVVLGLGLIAAAGSQAVERSHRSDLAYRGPSPVIAFVVAIAITLVAIVVVLAPLSALGMDPTSPGATALSLLLTLVAYAVTVRLLVVGPGSLTWAEMGVRRPDAAAVRDLLIGALCALPVLVVTIALSLLLGTFLERTPSPLPQAGDAAGLLLNLVSAAVLAPVGEELFFRGFATTAWARSLGSAWPAIARGAVFFAIAHVLTLFDASFATGAQRALFSFLALLPVGVALGWLFLARRSLYASIGLHAAFNGIQVLLAFAAAGALGR
ncbi:MAG TPA: type II CAAX endopeptidase family protein [Candidatus Limnocylindrales bacterium]